ncbi:MAG TPA: BspA family leucine-rich repeat surface protein, partial [Wenzhouxiangella sp.]
TTLREDLADGQISPDQQSALVQSAVGALSTAQTINTHLAAVITGTPQAPITLPALSPLLTKTLETNAHRVEIGAGTGGEVEPSGTRWLMSNQTQTVSLTPTVGHELIDVASTCGGALDDQDPQNPTFTTAAVSANCVLNASFELKSYPIAIQVPDGAVLTPALPEAIDHGQVASFVVTPPQGFDGITLTGCGGQLLGQTYTTAAITAPCTLSLAFYQKFFMADNATTVLCPDAQVGDVGTLNGTTYTKRDATQINPDNATTTCTSGITDMSGLFEDALTFNGDIRHWDTQAVTHMDALFKNAQAFDQDLGGWCVEGITTPPTDFDVGADGWVAVNARPNWGINCDLLTEVRTLTVASSTGGSLSDEGSMEILHGRRRALELSIEADYGLVSVTGCGGALTGTTYLTGIVTADCTITATFGPFYLADNGLTVVCTAASLGETGLVDGVVYTKRGVGDITPTNAETTCTTGITDMSGLFANEAGFNADIAHWDTASVTNMMGMFQGAATFNQDLQAWDTRQVTDMNYMFYQAGDFAQDLSGWCAENVTSTPFFFGLGSGLTSEQLPLFGEPCGP